MKTIVWDVDDVLNTFQKQWFEYWKSLHSNYKMDYIHLTDNPPHQLLDISLDEYRESIDEFRQKIQFDLKPNQDILRWFETHGNQFRHIALTSVPMKLSHISASWTFQNYGQWIRSFNVVPSKRKDDNFYMWDNTKKDYLAWLSIGDVFIDDSLKNLEGFEDQKIQTLIMPQPWNHSNSANFYHQLYELGNK